MLEFDISLMQLQNMITPQNRKIWPKNYEKKDEHRRNDGAPKIDSQHH